jgi:putative transposase
VSILTDYDSYNPLEPSDKSVGIDVGILSFAALSDGTFIENPRFHVKEEKNLAKVQRKHFKATKGTPERKKALKVLCRVHERISNKREDFIQKLSKIVKPLLIITELSVLKISTLRTWLKIPSTQKV